MKRSRFMEKALSSIADGVVMLDAQGRVVFVNEAARQLVQLGPARSLAWEQLVQKFGPRHADGSPMPPGETPLSRALQGEIVTDSLFLLGDQSKADGHTGDTYVSMTAGPVRDEDGQVVGAVSIFRKVSGSPANEPIAVAVQPSATGTAQPAQEPITLEDLARREKALREKEETLRRERENLRASLDQLGRVLRGTAQAMARTVEMRDLYAAGHQQRVADLAVAIGQEMGMEQDRLEALWLAAMVHDLGKIRLPAKILGKPGSLSGLEFELAKMHPYEGYAALQGIEFPWPIADIVLYHHERMNGSGYPRGVAGEAIPLEARVLAVADVVEAMTSHRPYRSATSLEQALEELERGKGDVYDPAVVDACRQVFTVRGFTFVREGS